MLVLLSAPRGRVSAARVAARAREDGAGARRIAIRIPAIVAAEGPADTDAHEGARWQARAGQQ